MNSLVKDTLLPKFWVPSGHMWTENKEVTKSKFNNRRWWMAPLHDVTHTHTQTCTYTHTEPFVAGRLPLSRRLWDQACLRGGEPAAPPSTFCWGATEREASPHADRKHHVCRRPVSPSAWGHSSGGRLEVSLAGNMQPTPKYLDSILFVFYKNIKTFCSS